jgi:Ca-activated chloride channel family protein
VCKNVYGCILKKKTMRYHIIFIMAILFLQAFMFRNSLDINGVVVNEQGTPVQAIRVSIKGSQKATTTNAKGMFQLASSTEQSVILVFSGNGYESQEVYAVPGKPVQVKLRHSLSATSVKSENKILPAPAAESITYAKSYDRQRIGSSQYPSLVHNHDGYSREGYDHIRENGFRSVSREPLSTFSIDVDGASYSNVRRFLNNNTLPPAGAVRVEEMINYFQYGYAQPKGNDPFSLHAEMAACPWNSKHKLVLVGLQGRKISAENLPPSNLTFLIDVSGSMSSPDKLPLVKSALGLLADQLREEDMISIVVYAGAAGLVLPPVSGSEKSRIKSALDGLNAGGSTAGGAGIQLAYQTARQYFKKNGNNRVILCTDGDFNVGMSSDDEMERLIEKERNYGVFLTVLGFGTGNYQDAKMQKLADRGNGNHAYIDQLNEAKKVFVNEFGGTMFTIAKDVKMQLEFNPAYVKAYRLVGYENRLLQNEDFNDDKKDAGELGSGHTVTALYEIIPAGVETDLVELVDGLKYQDKPQGNLHYNNEVMSLKARYKHPDGNNSMLMVQEVKQNSQLWTAASDQFRFAAAVAQMGMLLRNSEFKGNSSFAQVVALASSALRNDPDGYRKEFIQLAEKAARLH